MNRYEYVMSKDEEILYGTTDNMVQKLKTIVQCLRKDCIIRKLMGREEKWKTLMIISRLAIN